MSETKVINFDFKEIVELLVKKQGIHEGYWQFTVEFGLGAANLGPSSAELRPAAVVAVAKIGITRVDELTNLAVDAAVVNPAPGSKSSRRRKTGQRGSASSTK
jgi:hypothetical protein